MRKVVASERIPGDGVVQARDDWEEKTGGFQGGGCHVPYWSNELERADSEELSAGDILLLGRVAYEGFAAAAWAEASHGEGAYANRMKSLPDDVTVTATSGSVERWCRPAMCRRSCHPAPVISGGHGSTPTEVFTDARSGRRTIDPDRLTLILSSEAGHSYEYSFIGTTPPGTPHSRCAVVPAARSRCRNGGWSKHTSGTASTC